jgi:exodeoxyribonuclease V gamma subunit
VDAAVAFAAAVDRYQHEPLLPAHEVALPVTIGGAPCVLSGEWGDLRQGGLVRVDFRRFSAGHLIGAWIEHVVLCCAPPSGMTLATKQLFRDELVTLSPPADPQAVLADLLEAYAEGQHHPLPFYPKSSFTLVDEEKGLTQARKAFNGSDYSTAVAESSYAAVKLAVRGVPDPLGQAFQDLSRRLLGPLMTALQRGPL